MIVIPAIVVALKAADPQVRAGDTRQHGAPTKAAPEQVSVPCGEIHRFRRLADGRLRCVGCGKTGTGQLANFIGRMDDAERSADYQRGWRDGWEAAAKAIL